MRKLLVRMASALGVLVVPLALAACTPAARPLTALRYDDGRPVLLVVSCPDFHADSISVYTDGASPAARWAVTRGNSQAADEVRLLDPPAGWTVGEHTLTGFAPDIRYAVSVFDRADPTTHINFTVADLGALAPGEVLVGEPPSGNKAVTEAAFRETARKSCR